MTNFCVLCSIEVVSALLDPGRGYVPADPSATVHSRTEGYDCQKQSTCPVLEACSTLSEAIVRLLLKRGASMSVCQANGDSPLWRAVEAVADSTDPEVRTHNAHSLNRIFVWEGDWQAG